MQPARIKLHERSTQTTPSRDLTLGVKARELTTFVLGAYGAMEQFIDTPPSSAT